MDLTDKIISYEQGDMNQTDMIAFFGELVRSGMAWQLQGSYGRTAIALMKAGKIGQSGEVLV